MTRLYPYASNPQISEYKHKSETKIKLQEGLYYYPSYLSAPEIALLFEDLRSIIKISPFYQPKMPRTGVPFSVKMTCAGQVGWVSDKNGYRYQSLHPVTQQPWANIPKRFYQIWDQITGRDQPDCCLINAYSENAKMGIHRDADEKDFDYPVMSVSLGASALFRYGGNDRQDPTTSIKLHQGDIIVLSGASRRIYHGIDRIYSNDHYQSRVNITFRKAL